MNIRRCVQCHRAVLRMAQLLSERRATGRHTHNKTDRQGGSEAVKPAGQPAARRRRLRRAVLLTTRLTDGSRVFGAGSRPLLVKMVVQVPSCKESRADKLMDNHSRDTELCVE